METLFILLITYIFLFGFFTYVMICGNSNLHRNGIIGAIYRFLTKKIPHFFRRVFCRCLPEKKSSDDKDGCIGPGGPCRYFVAVFFYIIYFTFAVVYLYFVYPRLDEFYSNVKFHKFFSIWVLPWTWVCFIIFQFIDPGVITAKNVVAYLKKYHYDGRMYKPSMCPTDKIPIVPRSRYDRYTKQRIALYDHYCPWVVAPIGERTHRVFVAFLFFTVQASFYYSLGYFWVIKALLARIKRWPFPNDGILHKIGNVVVVCVEREPFVATCFFGLSVIGITLFVFLIMQCIDISRNLTQIEVYKLKEIREVCPNYRNPYDRGFFHNWKQLLFPSKLEPCKPFVAECSEDGKIIIPGYLMISEEELMQIEEEERKRDEEQLEKNREKRRLREQKEKETEPKTEEKQTTEPEKEKTD